MGLAIVSPEAFVHALDGAYSLQLSAYTLGSATQNASRVIAALEAAGDRGADVHVRLESNPYDPSGAGGLAQANRDAVAALRAHGVDAALSEDPNAPLHMKAAIVDGSLFLNDRNWPNAGEVTIVTTRDTDDLETVRKAFHGEHAADGHLATWKRRALELEADTIQYAPPGDVDVETESFGTGIVLNALAARLRAGDPVRLLVAARDLAGNAREADALRQLAAAGAEIRTADVRHADLDEKLCLASTGAWLGSANATEGFPETVDWGMRTRVPEVVDALRARFEQNWNRASAYTVPNAVA